MGLSEMRFYVRVDLDAAVRGHDRWLRTADSFMKVVQAFEDEQERAAWIVSKQRTSILLFFLLGYDVNSHYEVDPRKSISYEYFLTTVLDLGGSALLEVHHVFFRDTDAFAESLDWRLVEIEEGEQYYDVAIFPTIAGWARAEAIILREMLIFIVGGEIIRAGVWLIEWATDLRWITSATEWLLALIQRYQATAAAAAYLDELFTSVKVLGVATLQLLNVKYAHDLLLELVPNLIEIDRSVAIFLETQTTLDETGTIGIAGWFIEDDPVDAAIMQFLIEHLEQAAG